VHAVLGRLLLHFEIGSMLYTAPTKTVLVSAERITIMAISDANKKHMLEFEPLIDMMLECLIIDDGNRRKGQDGADALQETSAGVLHELSLFGPGADALRSHPDVVKTLHKLCEVGTKVSKERGAAALFELEQDKRPKKPADGGDSDDGKGTGLSSGQNPPPHVMVSYNWDHQDVILRVVGTLQGRGYLVWVDTEQMKGATVDTMALAVEGSEVVLVGVSRAYKESSNCRMEAQYALQKKKVLIPLMLVQGYEADGWLGLLLGTSMWYGFYGETLSSDSAFEARMDALCREIGGRGRADAAVVAVGAFDGLEPQPEVEGVEGEGGDAAAASTAPGGSMTVGTLVQAELSALRLKALQARAATEGVDEGAIDDALEADRPKVALVELILQHMSSCAQESAAGLRKLRPTQLKQRAREAGAPEDAIGATDDAPQPKEALIALVIGAEARGAGPPASPD
jgi:hypothetical protein